jgi:hypothetical protein
MTDQHPPPDPYAYDPEAARRAESPYAPQQSAYGQAPTYGAAPTYGQAPAYGQQPYGVGGYQPYVTPYKRPVWKIVVAVILFGIAGLGLLATLATLANPNGATGDAAHDAGYAIGRLIGIVLFCIVPTLGGVLLLRTPRRHR